MKLLKNKNAATDKVVATDVVSHDVLPLEVNTDASSHARFGWLIVLLGVGG